LNGKKKISNHNFAKDVTNEFQKLGELEMNVIRVHPKGQ
jgi:hypothetical protein